MAKQVQISPEVCAVLTRGSWTEGGMFHLPEGHLERSLYEAVDKVLRALGGKWDRKARGHRFDADASRALEIALTDGIAVDQKRTMEQFFTPVAIARQMADILGLPRADVHCVLEPSAGAGALVQALREHGVASIVMVELAEALADQLADQASDDDVVICADFMSWEPHPDCPPIDAVMMNPPFGRGADMAHVTRAFHFLRPGGTLVAIMSPHWGFASSAAAQAFRGLINEHSHDWTPLPEGSFRASGTDVNTGILTIRKGNI